MNAVAGLLRWAVTHRLRWSVAAAVVATLASWPFVAQPVVALLCGVAFGVVSAQTLPRPDTLAPTRASRIHANIRPDTASQP